MADDDTIPNGTEIICGCACHQGKHGRVERHSFQDVYVVRVEGDRFRIPACLFDIAGAEARATT